MVAVSAHRVATLLGPSPLRRPVYRALAERIRILIADGRIAIGTRLPGERSLAQELGVSRTTATQGYALLQEQGYLRSRPGAAREACLPGGQVRSPSGLPMVGEPAGGEIDLTYAAPRACEGLTQAFMHAAQRMPRYLAGAGYHRQGLTELREAIAQDYTDRGLYTTADEILITSGAMVALHLVTSVLVVPGDAVFVEQPCYANTIHMLRERSLRFIPVAVDASTGWDVSDMRAQAATYRPRAAYLIPDFHNPSGALMGEQQRDEVAQLCRAHHITPVVDETTAAIRLSPGGAPPSFACFAPEAITVGSASKTFWGGLRIGWIRASREVVESCVRVRSTVDLCAPVMEQMVLTALIAQGGVRLGDQRRDELRQSRDVLTEGLRDELPQWSYTAPEGGLSLWVRLPGPHASALAVAAEREGVWLTSGPRFSPTGGLEEWVRLPFTQPPEVLERALPRLVAAWRTVESGVVGAVPYCGHERSEAIRAFVA